jgi:hypothetical protein
MISEAAAIFLISASISTGILSAIGSEPPPGFVGGDLERWVAAFVEHYNHAGYRESVGNLTPADVYFGLGQAILI